MSSRKLHKRVFIPYTGWSHLCTASDKLVMLVTDSWHLVTCKHCRSRKGVENYL